MHEFPHFGHFEVIGWLLSHRPVHVFLHISIFVEVKMKVSTVDGRWKKATNKHTNKQKNIFRVPDTGTF